MAVGGAGRAFVVVAASVEAAWLTTLAWLAWHG